MITTVTLNLSVDRAYILKGKVKASSVMRVEKCMPSAGGKGLNVARIVKLCGETVLTTGFAGGHTGALAKSLMDKQEIPHDFVAVKNETRCCINILSDDGISTEFLEPGAEISLEEVKSFKQKFDIIAPKSDVIVLSGSVPEGVEKNIYQNLINIASRHNKPVILDTSGSYLSEGCKAGPFLIKPNKEELQDLLEIKIQTDKEIIQAARQMQFQGAQNVLVSLGARGAILVTKNKVYFGEAPKIKVTNTVGCGDSMVGAFAVALLQKKSLPACLADAITVSAANAMNEETGNFSKMDLDQIKEKIKISELAP